MLEDITSKKTLKFLLKHQKNYQKKKNFKLLIYGSGVNKLSSIIKVDNLEYFVKLIEPNKKINNTSENFKLPSSEVFSLYKQSNVF